MKNEYVCKVKSREELYIELPEDLYYEEGQKFSIKQHEDGSFLLVPYRKEAFDIDDDLFLNLAKMAHERDVTLNDLVNEILREQIEKIQMDFDYDCNEEMEESESSEEYFLEEVGTFNP